MLIATIFGEMGWNSANGNISSAKLAFGVMYRNRYKLVNQGNFWKVNFDGKGSKGF
uniref:Uncharacterized protein n=1 Tax=Rhizophagus irregularis (strain DAOM 181602 / DAOM 197198 / MUCL 43194) TaxID=747089 RepID=U9TZM7_RHIID